MDDMHADMRDIYGRLNSLDIAVAEIRPKRWHKKQTCKMKE